MHPVMFGAMVEWEKIRKIRNEAFFAVAVELGIVGIGRLLIKHVKFK